MNTAVISKDKLFSYLIVDDIQVEDEVLNKAKENDASSHYKIGEIYYSKKDYKKSMEWHLLAADRDFPDSQCRIGWMYNYGQGVTVDYQLAMEWYLKGHNNGSVPATNNIGALYDDGNGVSQDYKTALKWYLEAANKGSACAQYNVGVFYEHGRGVKIDKQYALEWYTKSAEQDDELAKNDVKRLNNAGYYINGRKKRHLQMEKEIKAQKEKVKELEDKLQEVEQKLDKIEDDNKSLRQKIEDLKLEYDVNLKEGTVSAVNSDKKVLENDK